MTLDWIKYSPPIPKKQTAIVFDDYPIEELATYIDWSPFFHAWELKGKYPMILDNEKYGPEAMKLLEDGKALLDRIISDKLITAKGVFNIFPAYAKDETVFIKDIPFHFPRQLVDKGVKEINYSLADFIAPRKDWLGLFAVTAGHGVEKLSKIFESENDDYSAIMTKILADRLAEAFAERMHQRVRKEYWGYDENENFLIEDLIMEKYRGCLLYTSPSPRARTRSRMPSSA